MSTRQIDYITEDFYESLSFMDGELPDMDTVRELFYDDGLLVNMSFGKPIKYSTESFIKAIEDDISDGQLTQFMQRELYSKTDIFGRIAQRTSVYEYSFAYHETEDIPKGINYIQFIQVDDLWKITSMVWSDEGANFRVPSELLSS